MPVVTFVATICRICPSPAPTGFSVPNTVALPSRPASSNLKLAEQLLQLHFPVEP